MSRVEEIKIKLDLDPDKELRQFSNEELAVGMDQELAEFSRWFQSKGNQGLAGIERSILKMYLAWKVVYAEIDQPAQATGDDHG